ncbi:hypothetical protein [Pseudoteredinibacter isoporae]|uniref:hypothetical protein n=1 Tax=Pseudoteredinibacter isoporae TaxID=570281 RepID=UPI0031031651
MANTNPGGDVATLSSSALSKLWGDKITVKKSQKPGKTYPLYMATPTGPVFLNSKAGQDFLLEHGEFKGASPEAAPEPAPVDSPETPADIPQKIPAAPQEPEKVIKHPPPKAAVGGGDEGTLMGWLDREVF